MAEVWKDIEGYEGLYQVSNLGRVKSLDRTIVYSDGRSYNYKSQILKSFKNKNGYLFVNLYKNGKRKNHLVHRLVWEAFNGPISDGMQCNHLSEDKTQNNLKNLNLMTPKENINFGTGIERSAKRRSKPVIQYDFAGNIIREWQSTMEVQRQTGYANSNISKCCNGLLKQAYGFIWRYAS